MRLEQTLRNRPEIGQTYHDVLREYLSLNHMEPTSSLETSDEGSFNSFYLPHYAVVNPKSVSTKVRVVLNVSKKTNSGKPLNDILHIGPTLQLDLATLILRWRLCKYVFSGDIEKVYRQIVIHKDDRKFQNIFVRFKHSHI